MDVRRAAEWGSKNAVIINIPGCDKDCSDEPSTEGARRHSGIIVIVNYGTNLGIWRVLVK